MFVLAHLSDPHLGPLPRPHPFDLLGKRAIGFVNWHRGRKAIHRMEVLSAIVHDLKAQNPDHIALTGDLVNIALPSEFERSRPWIDPLGSPSELTIVPGNHDFYVRRAHAAPSTHWGEFMRGDRGEEFPFLRERGPLALIGLSSAVATAPFMATGKVGAAQLEKLAPLLADLGGRGRFRVVLIHHPPSGKPGGRFKRLVDAEALRQVLREAGAELVLHGHDHVHSVSYLETKTGRAAIVGVPSASSGGGHGDPAAYNLYRIARRDSGWHCEAISRGFRRGHEQITELARRDLI